MELKIYCLKTENLQKEKKCYKSMAVFKWSFLSFILCHFIGTLVQLIVNTNSESANHVAAAHCSWAYVKMAYWSSNQASEWGRKGTWVTLNVVLVPHDDPIGWSIGIFTHFLFMEHLTLKTSVMILRCIQVVLKHKNFKLSPIHQILSHMVTTM